MTIYYFKKGMENFKKEKEEEEWVTSQDFLEKEEWVTSQDFLEEVNFKENLKDDEIMEM